MKISELQQLVEVCKAASSNEELYEAAASLDEAIFQSGSMDNVEALLVETIQPLLSGIRDKPVLVFHAYGWQYGGAERLIACLTNYLVHQDYRILLVVFEPINNNGYALDPSICFVPIYGDYDRIHRLMTFLALIRPDVFIGHNNSIPELFSIYPLLRQQGIRSIAYTLEYFFFPHQTPALLSTVSARNHALSQASVSCFLTRFSANVYGMSYPNAALMPGVNSFDMNMPSLDKAMGKTVVAVGRFNDPIKRLDRVLFAFKQVLVRHPDAQLLVVGPYRLKAIIPADSSYSIEQLMNKLDLPRSQIRFVGEQQRTQDYYKQGDVFVLTSNNEGFPLVLSEAGSYGLPAVIVDIPGLEDIIIPGENGYIVSPDDMEAMGDTISDLFDTPDRWHYMSRRSQELVHRFSIESVGSRWDELIQMVLKSSSQQEMNRRLSEQFMEEVRDGAHFIRRVIREYELAASQMARVPNVHHKSFSVSNAVGNVRLRIRNYYRTYGFRETVRKVQRKVRALIKQRYTQLK